MISDISVGNGKLTLQKLFLKTSKDLSFTYGEIMVQIDFRTSKFR